MQEINTFYERMRVFEKAINSRKELSVHKNNKFNKQFSVLLKDWNYLKIIIERIELANSENTTQLGLDLKSLYVFGRVFSESLLYLASFFIKSSSQINWEKIGPFIGSVKKNLESEPAEFKDFWKNNERAVRALHETFRYRNNVLHEKDSNTEWTFAWPGRSNLDNVYIANVPWKEDSGRKEEKNTMCQPCQLPEVIYRGLRNILSKKMILNFIKSLKVFTISQNLRPKKLCDNA